MDQKGSVRVLLPAPNTEGKYRLQVSELQGIEDLETVSGKYAQFVFSPRVNLTQGRLEGETPKARFIRNSDGDFVPADDFTQQLASVYLHMQKLALLDEELGIGHLNPGPRQVGVAVRTSGAGGAANNAFYHRLTDSILFVPYTLQGLPIPVNGGILAHEHFHSIYAKLAMHQGLELHEVRDILPTAEQEVEAVAPPKMTNFRPPLRGAALYSYYHDVLTSAMNEGFADFWGWLYSGDPDFIVASLPIEPESRTLAVPLNSILTLPAEERIVNNVQIAYTRGERNEMHTKEMLLGYAYRAGTQFSRVLKRYADIYAQTRQVDSLTARKEVARVLIKTLPVIRQQLTSLQSQFEKSSTQEGFKYTSVDFVLNLVSQAGKLNQAECEFFAHVLLSAKNSDAAEKYSCSKQEEEAWAITVTTAVEKKSTIEESLRR